MMCLSLGVPLDYRVLPEVMVIRLAEYVGCHSLR